MLSFFPRDVLDEILNLIESVSEDFPSYSDMLVRSVFSLLYILMPNYSGVSTVLKKNTEYVIMVALFQKFSN